jgi:enoyl-CoA hydratase/carnithine racemase
VDAGHALITAQELAARLAAKPPTALALTKKLLRDTTGTVMDRITAEGAHFAARLQSEEAREVFRKFLSRARG